MKSQRIHGARAEFVRETAKLRRHLQFPTKIIIM